jgi:hypothetical protein
MKAKILPNKISIILYLALIPLRSLAQGTEQILQAALLSYFAGGFALLFTAVFAFSYTIKSILNSRSQQWTNKQILKSSLRWALIIALIMVVGIYLFLQ